MMAEPSLLWHKGNLDPLWSLGTKSRVVVENLYLLGWRAVAFSSPKMWTITWPRFSPWSVARLSLGTMKGT